MPMQHSIFSTTPSRIFNTLTPFLLALVAGGCATAPGNDVVAESITLTGEFALPINNDQSRWLTVGDRSGIRLQDQRGEVIDHWEQPAEYLDQRTVDTATGTRTLYASIDPDSGRVLLYSTVDDRAQALQQEFISDTVGYPVQGLCLHRDLQNRLHLFVLNERFAVHQYLLAQQPGTQNQAEWNMLAVRTLPLGAEAEFCTVDDDSGTLFVSEGEFSIWAYDTDPEADVARTLVDAAEPFGNLGDGSLGIAFTQGTLYALSADGPTLHEIRSNEGEYRHFSSQLFPLPSSPAESVESLSLAVTGDTLHLTSFDEDQETYSWLQLPHTQTSIKPEALPEVMPVVETEPMPQWGDAADDPALWLHPQDPTLSLVLGTNKRQGLFVYDLSGRELQRLDVGRLNNVDVRYNARWQGRDVDLAAASNRDINTISLFAIDRRSRELTLVTEVPTTLSNVYGLCMYQQRGNDDINVFINDEDGRYQQYGIHADGDVWSGTLLREFSVQTQPEGCVANDRTGQLFVGEEDVGIWVTSANAEDVATLEPVAMMGDSLLHDDVEGLGIYSTAQADYLLASSQGNNSYVLFESVPPYRTIGAFRVGMAVNGLEVIDGASETDGLEVINTDLGGIYDAGVLIVQDGRNVTPEEPQNFKLIPWSAVRSILPH